MRGYGNPQGFFAGEIEMDRAAEALGMDPVEIRLRNIPEKGEKSSCGIITPGGLKECLLAAAGAAGFREKWKGWKS